MLIARDYSRKSAAKLLLFLQTRKYFGKKVKFICVYEKIILILCPIL